MVRGRVMMKGKEENEEEEEGKNGRGGEGCLCAVTRSRKVAWRSRWGEAWRGCLGCPAGADCRAGPLCAPSPPRVQAQAQSARPAAGLHWLQSLAPRRPALLLIAFCRWLRYRTTRGGLLAEASLNPPRSQNSPITLAPMRHALSARPPPIHVPAGEAASKSLHCTSAVAGLACLAWHRLSPALPHGLQSRSRHQWAPHGAVLATYPPLTLNNPATETFVRAAGWLIGCECQSFTPQARAFLLYLCLCTYIAHAVSSYATLPSASHPFEAAQAQPSGETSASP